MDYLERHSNYQIFEKSNKSVFSLSFNEPLPFSGNIKLRTLISTYIFQEFKNEFRQSKLEKSLIFSINYDKKKADVWFFRYIIQKQ